MSIKFGEWGMFGLTAAKQSRCGLREAFTMMAPGRFLPSRAGGSMDAHSVEAVHREVLCGSTEEEGCPSEVWEDGPQ